MKLLGRSGASTFKETFKGMSVLQGQWVTDKSVWVKDATGHLRRISLQLAKFSEPWKLLCGHLLESAHPPRGREEINLTRNAMLRLYYSSAFHFQSGHAFVTKTLLKAQLWGALCTEPSWSHPPSPALTLLSRSNKRPFF